MSVVAGINPSNVTKELQTDSLGNLKVDIAAASHSSGVDPNTYTESVAVPALGTGSGSPMNTVGYNVIGFGVSTTNTTDPVYLQASIDSLNFFTVDAITNPIRVIEIKNPAFKFYRVTQTDTTGFASTLSITVSRRYLI